MMDFHSLYQSYAPQVHRFVLFLCGDAALADDVTSETFVRAWTALPNFRGQSQFRTWLYRIVTNLCYNRLPNLRRSLTDLGDDVISEIPETDLTFDNPARGFESRELRSYLHDAIENLDENYRLLISLRYQNELSYEEMANMLNLPLGTVKTGLYRAKEQLRLALDRHQEAAWITP